MATDTTYNGWKNRQTWNVALWFDNEESMYLSMINRGNALRKRGQKWNASNVKRFVLARMGDKTPDGDGTSRVNWTEIAASFNESCEL